MFKPRNEYRIDTAMTKEILVVWICGSGQDYWVLKQFLDMMVSRQTSSMIRRISPCDIKPPFQEANTTLLVQSCIMPFLSLLSVFNGKLEEFVF